MANSSPKFLLTYTGPGVINLGKAGTFQCGTQAWVDESTAEMARTQADFVVTTPWAETMERMVDEIRTPPPEPATAPAPVPTPTPVSAAAAPAAKPRPQRKTRATGAVVVPAGIDIPDDLKK